MSDRLVQVGDNNEWVNPRHVILVTWDPNNGDNLIYLTGFEKASRFSGAGGWDTERVANVINEALDG